MQLSQQPWGCLQLVYVVFPDHTHLLFMKTKQRHSDSHGLEEYKHAAIPAD